MEDEPRSYVEYEWECGVTWEKGKPASHHICVGRRGECGLLHRCACGEVMEEEVSGDAV